jgi:hypothetical protein
MKTRIKLFIVTILLIVGIGQVFGQESPFPPISGWKINLNDQVYDSNNLWDIIDGAADLFLEYAFINLHTAYYVNADSLEIKVEIYRHNTPLDAFGIYSQERDPKYNFIKIGAQGYLQTGVLNFLTGCYYIKLSSYKQGDEAKKALLLIAKRIEEHLAQKNTLPEIFQYFPKEGKLNNTEQYIASNFLGYSFLKSVSTALYKFENNTPFKLFVIEAESSVKAKIILEEYLNKLPKENIIVISKDDYDLKDVNSGQISTALQNKYLYGIVNCPNKNIRIDLMQKFKTLLTK